MAGRTRIRAEQDRAIDTRGALLCATVDCLVDRGYAATTTTEVARRARVSRGAELHHFRSRHELLAAAVEHVFDLRIAEFSAATADLLEGPERLSTVIDLLWDMFQGPTYIAWVELWVAARTDAKLRAAVMDVDRRFVAHCTAQYAALFPDTEPEMRRLNQAFGFVLLSGLALQQLNPHDYEGPPDQLIAALKTLAQLAPLTP